MATSKPKKASAVENGCANCQMHGWKMLKLEYTSEEELLTECFLRCDSCSLIQYCGEPCRDEHYDKVHKHHCKFLVDTDLAVESGHDAQTCAICLQEAAAGGDKNKMATNRYSSTYRCIFKEKIFPPSLKSPHPFPLAGLPEDQMEMAIYVCQLLLEKIQLTKADRKAGKEEVAKIKQDLWRMRGEIWKDRKVLSWISREEVSSEDCTAVQVLQISSKIIKGGKVSAKEDPFQLWSTFQLLGDMIVRIGYYRILSAMKDPKNTFPEESRHLAEQAISSKYLAIAGDILHSLSTQVIHYEDIVEKICGGDRNQQCSFCFKKIVVMKVFFLEDKSRLKNSVVFNSLFTGIYLCDSLSCAKMYETGKDNELFKFEMAVLSEEAKRESSRCDYCFKLGPATEGHRCNSCLRVFYCSRDCHKEDQINHMERYCQGNVEDDEYKYEDDWKMKEGREERKTEGKVQLVNLRRDLTRGSTNFGKSSKQTSNLGEKIFDEVNSKLNLK